MEFSTLGVKWELPLPAYTTATATVDSKPIEQDQGWKPHPMDPSRVHYLLSH